MPKKAILSIAAASVIAIPLISSAGPLSKSVKETKTGLVRHSKKIPQCAHVTSVDLGRVQTLNYGYSTVDAIYETDENNKLQSVTLYGAAGIKNDSQLRAMSCATIALMMTNQPKYQTIDQATNATAHLWNMSLKAPFTMAHFFDQITAQHAPFQAKLWNK